jgi:hypothetical protein
MAGSVSTIPAVKAWLYSQLQSGLTPASGVSLLVRYGQPGPYEPEDIVSINTTQRTTEPYAMTGSESAYESFLETYTITVTVDVMRQGVDIAQTADTEAYALAGQVEDIVRADPTAGGTPGVLSVKPVSTRDTSQWGNDNKGYRITVTVSIRVKAVI